MKTLARALWTNEFFKGGLFLTCASFLTNILNYFFNFITARSLGPQGFSEIAALFSYVSIASVPIGVISLILIQKISSTKYDRLSYTLTLEHYFLEKIGKWWYLGLPLLFIIPFIPRLTNLSFVTSMTLIPFILIAFLGSFYQSAMQGLRLFFLFSIITTLGVIIKLSGAVITILTVPSILIILVFLLIATIIPVIIFKIILNKQTIEKTVTKGTIEKRLITIASSNQIVISTLSILALTLFNNIDIIFVKKFFDASSAGIYSSWSLFAKIILYVVAPLSSISFVFFASKESNANENKSLVISLLVLLGVAIGSYLGYLLFAPVLISMLFGSKFEPIIPYLAQASLFGSFYTAISFINSYFIAKKSNYALILPICIPLYIVSLFILGKTVSLIYFLNISFAGIIALMYIIAWCYMILYNKRDET